MDTQSNTPREHKTENKGAGPIIGTLIIVIVLIIAILYFWGQHLNTQEKQQLEAEQAISSLGDIQGSTTIRIITSTSTKLYDIGNDLNKTNVKTNKTI